MNDNKVLQGLVPLAESQWDFSIVRYYLRIENAEGYVLIAVYLFIYLYACYSHEIW